jgi:hypothetical protein
MTADASLSWTLVAADAESLTIIDLALPTIAERARRSLGDAVKAAPEAFSGAAHGAPVSIGQFRLAADGVFVDGVKVAELDRLLRRVPVADVLTVSTGPERRGSAVAAALGTLGGLWLGAGLAVGLAESTRCYDSCGAVEATMLTAFIGVPLAAGYGAWYGTSRVTEEIVYRRPPGP